MKMFMTTTPIGRRGEQEREAGLKRKEQSRIRTLPLGRMSFNTDY